MANFRNPAQRANSPMGRRMLRALSCLAALCAFGFASADPSAQNGLANLPNVSFPAPHRVASGAVQASDIAALQKAGVKEVIDLRADSETPDFDEAAAMQKAHIAYHNLPIRSPSDMSRSNIITFDRLLNGTGDRLTLGIAPGTIVLAQWLR